MRVLVLGSGTSTGVPLPACNCSVCSSSDPRNTRLRASVLVEIEKRDLELPASSEFDEVGTVSARILVDTSPDLRYQALRARLPMVDAVLYTHAHADHINGIDDLRGFCFHRREPLPVFADEETSRHLRRCFAYAFREDRNYLGGAPPRLELHRISAFSSLQILGAAVLPLPARHGRLDVLGFRFGSFAYVTDCKKLPDRTRDNLRGLDILILGALREREHRTHFSVEEALALAADLSPRVTYLTHLSHEVEHESLSRDIERRATVPVHLAYDGLHLTLADPYRLNSPPTALSTL